MADQPETTAANDATWQPPQFNLTPKLRRKITRVVHEQQKARGYKDTTLGAVAAELRMSLDDTYAAIQEMCGYWVCCQPVDGETMAEWPVFEDGE